MNALDYCVSLKCGFSRRKTENLNLAFGSIKCRGKENDWTCKVVCSGKINEDRELEATSAFYAATLGMAFLRQSLRLLKTQNSKIKFYEEYDGDLNEISIDEIFDTDDCVTDEMEEIIDWAQENGYEPD